MTVTIVTCSKAKLPGVHPARRLYSASRLFNRCMAQADKDGHPILILSTKYGLISPERMTESYELDLAKMPAKELERWQALLERQLRVRMRKMDITRAVFLAGRNLREAAKSAFAELGVGSFEHRHWSKLSKAR